MLFHHFLPAQADAGSGAAVALSVTKTNIHQIPPDDAYFITWVVNYICPSSNIYGICLFSLFFLAESVVDTHHIIAFNQINATEGSKGEGKKAFWLRRFFHGNTTASVLVSLIYFLMFFFFSFY